MPIIGQCLLARGLDLAFLRLAAALLFIGLIGLFVALLFDAEQDRIENGNGEGGALLILSMVFPFDGWQRSNSSAFGVEQRRDA